MQGVHPPQTKRAETGGRFTELAPGLEIRTAALTPQAERAFPAEAAVLLVKLHRALEPRRRELLEARERRQDAWNHGALPGYLDDQVSAEARGDWRVREIPADLERRRVEITGPISDPKMVINMLGRTEAGDRADAAMLDFEDSMKPSWNNVMQGVENLIGAADGSLTYTKPARGGEPEKHYSLDPDDMPIVMVRCRGLHLAENNVHVDGEPIAAGLLDLTLSAVHSARTLIGRGRTPKYYVPKVEHYREARWWNALLTELERGLSLETGSLRATFLIETLPAAFQMEEILWELRDHATGLNVGRWDKIFSDIKVLREHRDRVLADRGSISLNRPWMRNYAERLIRVCHRHGAFAMGGMAAFTPGRTPERREEQTRRVLEDKELESSMGHDGCWVSHPYFIGPAMDSFPHDNQLDVVPESGDRPELLPESTPPRTLDGLRKNARVGIAYVEGWSRDLGCVAWDDLMEDLATLEISRAQTWQWLRHNVALDDGTEVTRELVGRVFDEELERIHDELAEAGLESMAGSFTRAKEEAARIFTERDFRPFLSLGSEPVEAASDTTGEER